MTELDGKHVVILGGGRSGFAAARLAQSRRAIVRVLDSAPPENFASCKDEIPGIRLIAGEEALKDTGAADLVVVSPGIDLRLPIVTQFASRDIELSGEIEFAWRFWNGPVIGVTGTNGKTTATGLIAHILKDAGYRTVAAGNYGKPFSEVVTDACYDHVVLELSSFQLETIEDFRADIAVWLNFAADHMDRYDSLEAYREAKEALFKNQGEDDWAVVNAQNGPHAPLKSKVITFSAFSEEADFTFEKGHLLYRGERCLALHETNLIGKHNAENVMAALAVGQICGLSWEAMRSSIRTFLPHRHRCERVASHKGVDFINDSKATNLHALESSLRSLEGKILLIAGGKEKGLDYQALRPWFGEKVVGLICIGEIRHELYNLASDLVDCDKAISLEEAVRYAMEKSLPGQTVLFSPGTSSFDMFKGYEDRGDQFCALINQHLKNHG